MTRQKSILFALLAPLFLVAAAAADEAIQADAKVAFERDIRPILKAHCFRCHGEGDQIEGELDLRLRRLIAKGGESGSALSLGSIDESSLLARIVDGEMPPEEVKLRPSEEEVALLRSWLASGAKTLRAEPVEASDFFVTEEEQSFWSFQPIQRPASPEVKNEDLVRTPVDRFLLAKLEEKGLKFSPQAKRRVLLRRAYFDLVGMPPSPEETEQFLSDNAAGAYERLIDRLLNSQHYGERWGRHWLDVAGYADSEGYNDADVVRQYAYKYRDYVIRSFNADKPFDQFIQEQLAGDEMVDSNYKNLSPADLDKLIATGFLRMAADGTAASGADQTVARNDVVVSTIQIVSSSVLGLTVACAQCHNHRYDPIPQADYYRLRAIFAPAYDWKNWRTPPKRLVSLYTEADREKSKQIEVEAKKIDAQRIKKQNVYIEETFQKELAKLAENLRGPITTARNTAAAKRTPLQKKLLKENPSVNVTSGSLYLYNRKAANDLKAMAAKATKIRGAKPKEEFIRALTEPLGKAPPETFLFARGNPEQPKEKLQAAELSILKVSHTVDIPVNNASLPTTGRRSAYARWLTGAEHPLTARVMANRVWLHHFGKGIVETPGDFGYLGARPTHPELLDYLASEFVLQGWSLKKLHKLIMTSSAYRQASARDLEIEKIDIGNQLYWRKPILRLDAEALRDSVLAVSGSINLKPFGPPVPVMADKVGQFVIGVENLNAGRPGAVVSMKGEDLRRSVYVQVRRSRPLNVLDTFDAPVMTPNCTSRNSTTVATQSLMLMNSDFVLQEAGKLALRVRADAGDGQSEQIKRLWLLVYAGSPDEQELSESLTFLQQQTAYFKANPPPKTAAKDKKKGAQANPGQEALAILCHALLSSNEFLYID